jgi:hypothetical protein
VPIALAQPPQPLNFKDRMDAALIMDPFLGAHRPRQQMGRDDQDASGENRQLNKKSLELHHEEKECVAHGDPLR